MLLFLSREGDLHVDWIEAECVFRDIPFLRLNTRQFPQHILLNIHSTPPPLTGCIVPPNQAAIPLEQIIGIWHRRPEPVEPTPDLDEVFFEFAYEESTETLQGLYRALWDRRWVNPPHLERAADHKLYQLRVAQTLGFRTPRTLISNDPDEVMAFFQACGNQMIYKLMTPIFVQDEEGNPYGIYTTLITPTAMAEQLPSIRLAPCMFQELVTKSYELRVNVIGDHVWAAAIYSQEMDETTLDYRLDTDGCRHAPVLLPPDLEQKCLALNRRLGLRMSNLDLIYTPEGEYVFLEVNPNGQWAWVEEFTGFPLATALVDELLGVDTLADHPYRKERSLHFTPRTAIKGLGEHRYP